MLKIKDNVKLKDLEKFGFKLKQYFYMSYDYVAGGIMIDTKSRKIGVCEGVYIELLYDLIEAGLVEKVGE